MTSSPERVGLFGGSFDPVHRAHLALGHAALRTLGLREVRWVLAGQPWQKAGSGVSPAAHREAMLLAAIAGEPRFVCDRSELERAGPSYTIDTVEALAVREPGVEWVLVLGQDQYAGLPSWRRWRDLLARVTVAVAQRPGAPPTPPPELGGVPHRRVALDLPLMAVSSSAVRQAVAAGADIGALVPPEVARYIEINGLYKSPSRS